MEGQSFRTEHFTLGACTNITSSVRTELKPDGVRELVAAV